MRPNGQPAQKRAWTLTESPSAQAQAIAKRAASYEDLGNHALFGNQPIAYLGTVGAKSGRIMSSRNLLPPTSSLPANIDWAIVAFWLAYFGIYLNVALLLVP